MKSERIAPFWVCGYRPVSAFIAGDAATGASLVVRAMAGGRKAGQQVDNYLCGK